MGTWHGEKNFFRSPLNYVVNFCSQDKLINKRTEVLMTYALCGFGNISSMGIQVSLNLKLNAFKFNKIYK